MAKILLNTRGLARQSGISEEQIDAYEQAGLITPAQVIARERPPLTLWELDTPDLLKMLYRRFGPLHPRRHG